MRDEFESLCEKPGKTEGARLGEPRNQGGGPEVRRTKSASETGFEWSAGDRPPNPGPLVAALGKHVGTLVGRLAEPMYRVGINRRNLKYDRGDGVTTLPIPVVSVGNLSVGGTGKTPMVMKLVASLMSIEKHPAIAMRGYAKAGHAFGWPGAPRRSSPEASAIPADHERGEKIYTGDSDEADLYRRMLPGVPLVAQPDRIAGLRALLDSNTAGTIDCVVLDDGFQHRKLARNFDIVLLDATRDVFADRLLPAGWLREPVTSLSRAHAVVLTHTELASQERVARLADRAKAMNPEALICTARHAWTGLRSTSFNDGQTRSADEMLPVEWLAGKRVMSLCAIGNPIAFESAIALSGANVVEQLSLPDHDPYAATTLTKVLRSASAARLDAIVTTEKDWSKLGGREIAWPCRVARPVLELEFVNGWDDLARNIERVTRPRP